MRMFLCTEEFLHENTDLARHCAPARNGICLRSDGRPKNGRRGGHTWYEWGIPGDADAESLRIYRLILTGLLAAGFNTSDGKTVEPLVGPEGPRTTEEMYK